MQIQSMPDASPMKWHLAHTSWAFETFLLKPYMNSYKCFDSEFEYLFNSYYNAIGEQYPRNQRGLMSRPSIDQILDYRKHVDKSILALLQSELSDSTCHLVLLLINHEQQHQELMITDIKHGLFQNPTYPHYGKLHPKSNNEKEIPSPIEWIQIDAGIYEIGHQDDPFYFDNEGPRHKSYVEKFKLASRLITNGEYLEFIENDGYQNASYWLSEAWGTIKEGKTKAPLYWVKKQNVWFQFTLSGLSPIDLDAPVQHLNYFEANAYANSVGKRLPTEQEWEIAARSDYPFSQMFNWLWQWTSSSYAAYPKFKVVEGAIGEYNGKFMVNQYVLRGGSKVTPAGHIRPSYRNFFYPNASWQYSGLRLAE